MPPKSYFKRCSTNGDCDSKRWHTKDGCERDIIPGDVCLTQKAGTRSNPWIAHVKNYASRNGMSYSEALKDPNTRASYQSHN